MMQSSKRVISMLLVLVMLCGMIPLTTFATEVTENMEVTEGTDVAVSTEATSATEATELTEVTVATETIEVTESTEDTEATEVTEATGVNEETDTYESEVAHEHAHEAVVTEAACNEQGYTTYTCGCGVSYVADLLDAVGHTYENGICTGCDATVSPYLQQLPENMFGCTDLYDVLTPVKGYYTATKYDTGNGAVLSVVIPVESGDRISASSFAAKSENMGSVDGIRVTYLLGDQIATSVSAGEVYSGYTTNGYITVPDGVDAVCIPWWKPSDSNWLTLSQISKDFAVHSPKIVPVQEPTCTEIGYTAGEICEICNVSLGEREEIPAAGHTYSGSSCSVCGAVNLAAILNGKYVSVLGDSISTFNGYSNDATVNNTIGGNGPRYDVGTADTKPGSYCLLESVNDTWWMDFANRSGMKLLVNNSWAGSQVFGGKTSDGRVIPAAYLDRCVNLHDNTLENNPGNKVIDPDVVFVYLGINDYNFSRSNVGTGAVDYAGLVNADGSFVTPANFGEAYGIMLHKMQTAYPNARIFAMTLLPENLYSVDMTAWEQHNAYIRGAAEYYDIPVVDLAENCAITWENYSGYMMDKIHPTTAGMALISDCIEAELQTYYKGNPPHSHAYENGICTGCGAEDPNAAEPMSMRYDDHLDMSGKVVEIIDAGTPTSYQVGYGVEENAVPDTAVVTLEGDTLVATGIGTAKVKINGELYEITVTAAPISLLLLIGQSNMRGSEGNADQSIVCPDGMVYATFGDDRGDAEGIMNTKNATNFAASALTGEYSGINVNGTTDNLNYYPINSLTEDGKGTFGPDSGFAYEWVKQTGEKVWIVNAAHGGSSMTSWQPNATNFKEADLLFSACQETLRKEIAAGHFTLSHMGYFWCQGCSDYNWTAEKYVTQYLAMHNGLKDVMSFDHDSNAVTADKVLEFAGIIPVRAGHDYNDGYREGIYTDSTTQKFYESFMDLQMTGPRVAQYWMINNPELPDVWGVCNIGEDWVWMPDGTNGVVEYFQNHYPNGTVDYTTQVKQSASWYTPTTPKAVHDSIHYNQIGYNEVGREAARNALILLGEIDTPDVETEVKFVSWDGYTEMVAVDAYTEGKSETLVVPKVYPVWRSKKVSYTLTDGLVWNYYDLLVKNDSVGGTLSVIGMTNTVTVTGHSWSDWATKYAASADGPGLDQRVCSHCGKTDSRTVEGVWQIYDLSAHLLELPDYVCFDTNLWDMLPHEDVHFTSSKKWGKVSTSVPSITIPVNPGDRIFATSFQSAGINGHETSNGIRVTFFDSHGIAKTMGPGQTDREFYANGGYLIAPEGTIAVNIGMWGESEQYEIYILNRDHIYDNGTCLGCGDHIGPVIIRQPESSEQEIGKKFAITVKAESEGLTYQWYYKDSGMKSFGVSSNKTASYAYTMQAYMHNRQVYCVITDANGNSVRTETATITRPPMELKILQQPKDAEASIGEKFSISPKVEGDGLTYQWYYKDAGMKNFGKSSNKSSAYAYTMVAYMNKRQVYCVIIDKYGDSVTTDVAIISLPPVELKILQQPTAVYTAKGEKFSISPKVQGEGLTYQWYYKEGYMKTFKASSNKTSAYAYSMQNYMNNRQVYCVITDKFGNQVQTEVVTIHQVN